MFTPGNNPIFMHTSKDAKVVFGYSVKVLAVAVGLAYVAIGLSYLLS